MVFLCDFSLEDVCQFSKCIKFFVPKGENREVGAGFYSAMIKSVAAWVAASSEEIPIMVVSREEFNCV